MGMADIRAGVDRALGILADPDLTYRVGGAGAWVAFPGGVLNTDPPVGLAFDEDEGGEVQMNTASLVCAFTAPTLDFGDQVKDVHGKAWALLGKDRSVAAVLYRLRREASGDDAYGAGRPGREK